MERTSSANDLTERLRRRLECERKEIEELTASELGRLGENSRRVARNALRTIERDTEEATGRMRELLLKAWLRPLIVGLGLWLGIFGESWATMQCLSRRPGPDRDPRDGEPADRGRARDAGRDRGDDLGCGAAGGQRGAVRDAAGRHAGPYGLSPWTGGPT